MSATGILGVRLNGAMHNAQIYGKSPSIAIWSQQDRPPPVTGRCCRCRLRAGMTLRPRRPGRLRFLIPSPRDPRRRRHSGSSTRWRDVHYVAYSVGPVISEFG